MVILVILVIFGYFHMGNCTDVMFCLQPFWGETFDVHLGGEEYDAGITTEELLLIMANDEDKERAVSDESWALATGLLRFCLLYTSPSPRDQRGSRMPSSA